MGHFSGRKPRLVSSIIQLEKKKGKKRSNFEASPEVHPPFMSFAKKGIRGAGYYMYVENFVSVFVKLQSLFLDPTVGS